MLAGEKKEKKVKELQQTPSHAEGTVLVKCVKPYVSVILYGYVINAEKVLCIILQVFKC